MVPAGWLRKLFGDRGERLAARFLRRRGYRIVARQSRNRIGEIDIIAEDGDWIVFVEVKTRSHGDKGHPAEAVTAAKQRQLTRAALAWLKTRGLLGRRIRFDIVAITWRSGVEPQIEHLQHAFEASGADGLYG